MLFFIIQNFSSQIPSANLGTVEVRLVECCWTLVQMYSKRSGDGTLFCQNPPEVAFREPLERRSWKGS